jgi:hypothetical protein
VRRLPAVLIGVVLTPLLSPAPVHAALAVGNYNVYVESRYDFHTWIWSISSCDPPVGVAQCANVSANPTPIAKAFQWYGQARQTAGTYTLTVDVPDGLRCGDVYYGPVIPTRDVYTWDAATLAGTLQSSFTTGCDGEPGGTTSYPFRLVRL